jgi:hypothetical protein
MACPCACSVFVLSRHRGRVKLAQNTLPATGIWEWTMAITGFALIFLGIDWQSRSEVDKEHGGV